jgi:hypothetical protein
MPELTASTREAARRLGVSDAAIHKAERAGRIAREPDGQWDIDKARRRLTETADPVRSPLASGSAAEGTPFARLKVAQLALKVEAQHLSLDEISSMTRQPGAGGPRVQLGSTEEALHTVQAVVPRGIAVAQEGQWPRNRYSTTWPKVSPPSR